MKGNTMQLLIIMGMVFGLMMVTGCDKGTEPNSTEVPLAKPLELLSPTGGEALTVNSTVTISWRANDADLISSIGIKLSLDNGKSFPIMITDVGSIAPPVFTFPWTIKGDQVSAQCRIKIYEYTDESINDVSAVFTVTD